MTVLDWEVFALYRKQAQRKSPEKAVQDRPPIAVQHHRSLLPAARAQ